MVRSLGLLLLAQLVLVVALYWPAGRPEVSRDALVTDFAGGAVTQIEISDEDNEAIVLSRAARGWRMASGLPADADKVAALLSQFLEKQPGFSIAESAASARRFKVAPALFERRIVLRSAQGDANVYLGTAPSMRKVHARRDGEDSIFVMDFRHSDAPVDADSWLDTRLLAADQLSLVSVYGADFTLGGERWSRSDGDAVDQEAVKALVQILRGLQVTGVTAADDRILDDAGEALRLTLGIGDERIQLSVLDEPESGRYYLRSDRYPQTFDTSAYDAERLIAAARALVADLDDDDATDGGAGAEADLSAEESSVDPGGSPDS